MNFFVMFLLLAAAAAVLFFVSKKLGFGKNIDKYDVMRPGTVLEISQYGNNPGLYNVLVEYSFGDQTYREWSSMPAVPSSINSYLEPGSEIRVYVNSRNPSDVSAKHINGMGSKTPEYR